MKHLTVRQALQSVVDNPKQIDDDLLSKPVYEVIARNLFEIANSPDKNVKGSEARANRARKMIMNRLVGLRRAGSHPATNTQVPIEFVDLTKPHGEVEA